MHRPRSILNPRLAMLLASIGAPFGVMADAFDSARASARDFADEYGAMPRSRFITSWKGVKTYTADDAAACRAASRDGDAVRIERAITKRARRGALRLHEVSMGALRAADEVRS